MQPLRVCKLMPSLAALADGAHAVPLTEHEHHASEHGSHGLDGFGLSRSGRSAGRAARAHVQRLAQRQVGAVGQRGLHQLLLLAREGDTERDRNDE